MGTTEIPITPEQQNGSAGWKAWQVYVALLMLAVTLGTVVFKAGAQEERIERVEDEVKQVKVDYMRKDVVEQRLMSIEATEARIEESQRETSAALQHFLEESRRVR